MDQILAQETGKHTQLASLELAIESGETAGACDTGYACPYTNTISWKSPNTPLPTQNNPRLVFERLFGDSSSTDPKERLGRMREQKSMLDSVTQEVARLGGALPAKRPHQAHRVSRCDPRRRAAHSDRRRTRQSASAADRASRGDPGRLGRPRQVDVRSAGAGLPNAISPASSL